MSLNYGGDSFAAFSHKTNYKFPLTIKTIANRVPRWFHLMWRPRGMLTWFLSYVDAYVAVEEKL